MNTLSVRPLVAAVALAFASAGAVAQTIDNPSFSDAIASTDWNVYSGAGTVAFTGGIAALDAGAGSDTSGMMFQELSGLTAGTTYQISFLAAGSGFLDIADDLSLVNGLPLSNGSVGSGETDPAFAGWSGWMTPGNVFRVDVAEAPLQAFSMTFTASDSTEYLWVKGFAGNADTLRVDEFAMNPVSNIPEPASYAMLVAGLGVLGLMARRRRAG